MPSRAARPFQMALIATPLLAVPLLAIFGLPNFSPVSASPSGATGDPLPLADQSVGDSLKYTPHDLFAPVTPGDPSDQPPDAQPGGEWSPSPEALGSWQIASPGSDAVPPGGNTPNAAPAPRTRPWPDRSQPAPAAQPFPEPTGHAAPASAAPAVEEWANGAAPAAVGTADLQHTGTPNPSAPPATPASETAPAPARSGTPAGRSLTWNQATERLRSLGIRHYQLSPGHGGRDYHFCCHVTPAHNPRVTRRFEAEAADPLQAVGNVLAQVEDWHRRP